VISLDSATGVATIVGVFVNQHVGRERMAPLRRLELEGGGALTVTDDHVILIDGQWRPAGEATVGSSVGVTIHGAPQTSNTVATIVHSVGAVVNPVTTSGTILAFDIGSNSAGAQGAAAASAPVLASTHSAWLAAPMLNASAFPLPLSAALSRALPTHTQGFYSETLEARFLERLTPYLSMAAPTAATRPMLTAAALALVDASFAVGVGMNAALSTLMPAAGCVATAALALAIGAHGGTARRSSAAKGHAC